ncbi:hypothetical protein OEZ85_012319 [Tetradesmus obliquus]|uniref:BRISC and BRCA1-A complex member 1 n=1 Tax=Tetradesmus obliquus TaxID=3088 RepID=A0ABY8TSZ2_TETOB|nr:hypothetical protein OEZ85_012319 [Tetradesmus obliquus]
MVRFAHSPETIVFAIDLDAEMSTEATRGYCRLDVVKHAVTTFVLAKKRMCARHKFALVTLVQDEAVLLPYTLTSNTDEFLEYLAQLQPAAAAAEQQFITSDGGGSSSSSSKAFDFGSLISAVEPLLQQQQQQCWPQPQQQQQQQHHGEMLHVAGGTLTPAPALLSAPAATTSSSSSSRIQQQQQQQQQHSLRVILLYARSQLPAPELRSQQQRGLAMDCLYVHSKPQAGVNAAQEVYGALEELVDGLGVRAGHAPFIYEATAGRIMKLLSCMALLLAHPQQRQPQADTQPPLDISAAPVMQLPSDLANLASGLPIMTASRLPAPAAASAWAKPLVVSDDTVTDTVSDAAAVSAWGSPATAAAGGGSTGGAGAWGDAAAAAAAAAAGGGSSKDAAAAWGRPAPSAAAAAAGSAWSDPWDEAGANTPGFAAGSLPALQPTQSSPAAAAAAAAGAAAGSSNGTKAATVTARRASKGSL